MVQRGIEYASPSYGMWISMSRYRCSTNSWRCLAERGREDCDGGIPVNVHCMLSNKYIVFCFLPPPGPLLETYRFVLRKFWVPGNGRA